MNAGWHGAYPHRTIDPIVIGARIVVALQTIVAREINPLDPGVITVGSFHAGSKHNIIPDHAHLQLTVRAYSAAEHPFNGPAPAKLAAMVGRALLWQNMRVR
jgi:hippurate hydrolase